LIREETVRKEREMAKGLIFDIRRFCVHDGPGIRTTVFFKGCPLNCLWCHNPESRDHQIEHSVKHITLDGQTFSHNEATGRWMTPLEVMAEIERDRIFYDESGGGVTFSGGEPLMQELFLGELMKACRLRGIHTTLDTSGYASRQAMEQVARFADLVLFDLKLMDEMSHIRYTGVSNMPIHENLEYLVKEGKNICLRFPVIPGITDTTENIGLLKSFIAADPRKAALKISLLPYHGMAREKYRRFSKENPLAQLPDLKPEELAPLKMEFEALGLDVTIGS